MVDQETTTRYVRVGVSACLVVTLVVGAGVFGAPSDAKQRRRDKRPSNCYSVICDGVHADRTELVAGETTALSVTAITPDGAELQYRWTATRGVVIGDGATATFDSDGLAAGTYSVTCLISNGFGYTTECSTQIRVNPRPTNVPQVVLYCSRDYVPTGVIVDLRAKVIDPLSGSRPVSIRWYASQGTLKEHSATAELDTTGVVGAVRVEVSLLGEDSTLLDTDEVELTVNARRPCNPAFYLEYDEGQSGVRDDTPGMLKAVGLSLSAGPYVRVLFVAFGDSSTFALAQARAENLRRILREASGADEDRILFYVCSRSGSGNELNNQIAVFLVTEEDLGITLDAACQGDSTQIEVSR